MYCFKFLFRIPLKVPFLCSLCSHLISCVLHLRGAIMISNFAKVTKRHVLKKDRQTFAYISPTLSLTVQKQFVASTGLYRQAPTRGRQSKQPKCNAAVQRFGFCRGVVLFPAPIFVYEELRFLRKIINNCYKFVLYLCAV